MSDRPVPLASAAAVLALAVTTATVALPVAMLCQFVASLAADRSSRVPGLLDVALAGGPDGPTIAVGLQAGATAVLWLAVATAAAAVGTLLAVRRGRRADR